MQHHATPRRLRKLVAGAVCGLLAACGNPLDMSDYRTVTPTYERLHEIDAMRFVDRSRSAPVTVEDGAARVVQDVLDRTEPEATMDVTLAQVRADALANNLDLRVQFIAPAIAAEGVDEAEAAFEAVLRASARRTKIDSPSVLVTESSQETFDQYDLAVDVPLRTGGTLSVGMPINHTETDNAFALVDKYDEVDVSFSLSQPLLRNAGNRANTHAIRVAHYEQDIVGAQTKLEAMRVLAAADRAYWEFYAARRELEVRVQEYDLARDQLERAQRRVTAGADAEIEVIRAESGVAQRLEGIIVAETNLRRSERNLKRILNRPDLPLVSPTALVPATEPDPLGLDLDPAALSELAVANRMEMLELELQLAIDASSIDLERNRALPLVTLDYRYNLNGVGTNLSAAYDLLGETRFADWVLGVSAEIPLGNEAAEARVDRAILTRLQRLASRAQRDLAIRQEVLDALDQLQQNWQRILAARQDAILAGRTYQGEQRQFEVGERTSTDVLDAAARLADAQTSEIRAMADYQIALVDLAFATGTLLGHDRVRWETEGDPDPKSAEATQASDPGDDGAAVDRG